MFRNLFLVTALVSFASIAAADPGNRGYSGAPGTPGRCASACHGVNGGTVQITGFPTEYVPDSTYLITIQAVSGLPIKNFNGSVRRGTSTANAGVITAATNTTTYNVVNETNGIHLNALDRQSATFNWRAPDAGTGTVRLYVGAHQGERHTGPNTNITLISDEAVLPAAPGQAQNPNPADGASNVAMPVILRWSSAAGAESYEIFLGTAEPLLSIGSSFATSIVPPDLLPGQYYIWRVDAINDGGTTPGDIWSFTTESGSDAREHGIVLNSSLVSAYPNPFNSTVILSLTLANSGLTTVTIFDITGREIATLANEFLAQGEHRFGWNAAGYAAGIYVFRCDCAGLTLSQKVAFLP
ncbi:MAG: T9SS type A sorting domain-containing protein [bacterium]|nr:T9SS type A sorting domain-containing protein [bacterium]